MADDIEDQKDFENLKSFFEDFSERFPGFPLYCSELFSGKIHFVSKSFAKLVGRKKTGDNGMEFEPSSSSFFSAKNLYMTSDSRADWIKVAKQKDRDEASIFHTKILCGIRETENAEDQQDDTVKKGDDTNRIAFHAIDIFTLKEIADVQYCFGMLLDYHQWSIEKMDLQNRLTVYREVMNLVSNGFHEIDHDGNIVFMNKAAQNSLGIRPKVDFEKLIELDKAKHVCYLSPNEAEHEAKRTRVHYKILHGGELTRQGHREFTNPFKSETPVDAWLCSDEGVEFLHPQKNGEKENENTGNKESVVVRAVNITDFAIPEADRAKQRANCGIYTLTIDEQVPDDIARLLKSLGPQNPMLEKVSQLEISAFLKVLPEYSPYEKSSEASSSDDLVFTFLNKHVEIELDSNPVVRKIKDPGKGYLGLNDSELWPEFSSQYTKTDRWVLENKTEDHRIEGHKVQGKRGVPKGNTDFVQVLKVPVYLAPNGKSFCFQPSTEEAPAIGVAGFYWKVVEGELAAIHNKLRQALQSLHWTSGILDTITTPICVKDSSKKYVYANQAYINELKDDAQIKTLFDLIGKSDDSDNKLNWLGNGIHCQYSVSDDQLTEVGESTFGESSGNDETIFWLGRDVRVHRKVLRTINDECLIQTEFWPQHEARKLTYKVTGSNNIEIQLLSGKLVASMGKTGVLWMVLIDNMAREMSKEELDQAIKEKCYEFGFEVFEDGLNTYKQLIEDQLKAKKNELAKIIWDEKFELRNKHKKIQIVYVASKASNSPESSTESTVEKVTTDNSGSDDSD